MDGLKIKVASPTAPNMDLPLIPFFSPFGGNQRSVTMGAAHTEGRTVYRRDGRHRWLRNDMPDVLVWDIEMVADLRDSGLEAIFVPSPRPSGGLRP